MKILVINCSPVKNGATAEIVRLVSDFCGKATKSVRFALTTTR